MPLSLSTLRGSSGAHRAKKRLGRGNASGHGTYSTRGIKGQRARQGGRKGLTQFGAKHFVVHLPKVRGFQSFKLKPQVVDVMVFKDFANGTEVTPELLVSRGLIERADRPVKVIGSTVISHALTFKVHGVSAGARAAIEKAGGKVEILPKSIVERRAKARRKQSKQRSK